MFSLCVSNNWLLSKILMLRTLVSLGLPYTKLILEFHNQRYVELDKAKIILNMTTCFKNSNVNYTIFKAATSTKTLQFDFKSWHNFYRAIITHSIIH